MAEDDCGATFALAQGDEVEIIPVMIDVTDSAMSAMEGAMSSSDGDDVLVVSVLGGGCSGFMYDLDFCQPGGEDGDRAFDFDGISLYCDRKSYLFVIGTRLDWEDSLQSTGFVFKNPNETGACGCGESVLF